MLLELVCGIGVAGASALASDGNSNFTGSHKIQVNDRESGGRIAAQGGRLIADYGGYQLYETGQVSPEVAANRNAQTRDDYNSILLHARHLDTRRPEIKALRQIVGAFPGKRMHLVQFAGPVRPEWREELLASGARIVAYVPYNSYLIYGGASSIASVQKLSASAPHIQWEGAYLAEYKIHPRARTAGTGLFALQLVADEASNPDTLALLDRLKLEPVLRRGSVLNYLNLVARLNAADLSLVAAQPDVVSILPYFPPHKSCERQDQIVAGNLNGNVPAGPGYLAWLGSRGFTQAQFDASGFVVDVSDSGIDDGTTQPNHFGLYAGGDITGTSRVVYNRLEGSPNPGSTLKGCDGHGNINAHIAGGYDNGTGFPFADSAGYHYGLGVCPFVRLGSSVIYDPDNFTDPNFSTLQSDAYQSGARISNNSWGATGSSGVYDSDAQNFDALVRDAQPAVAGNQEMVIVFAAGNDGPGTMTVESPGSAKNVITVGAGDNVQAFGGADGSGVGDGQANNANNVIDFSGEGPCADGRAKPDLIAPGTHVSGGVTQAANPGPDGTADSCFLSDGTNGVSGGLYPDLFFPANQQFYTASSGTSHSTPGVTGGCALVRQYFINNFGGPPSPAMTKAYLMNSARYMTGQFAGDTLWSETQGMGEMNLGAAFDGTPRILRDQVAADLFTASGQTRTFTGTIAATNLPFRVTAAWTDAPGSTTGSALNNDLDLTVTVGGNTYKGNVFGGAYSTTGGAADTMNNVESVFLPAGVSGNFVVTVTGAGINSIGVPNGNSALEQDFALVVYNGSEAATPVLINAGSTLTAESCMPTNGAIDPGETVTVTLELQNMGTLGTTNLVATLEAGGGVTAPSGPQAYGALKPGGGISAQPFTFTASGACGGTLTASLLLQDGPRNLGVISFDFPLGQAMTAATVTTFSENFDDVTAPALPSGWSTTASGAEPDWVTTTAAFDTSPNSAYVSDPYLPSATTSLVGLSELVAPAISIVSPAAQLSFRNNYNLEASQKHTTTAYDGGVLEIQIGNGGFVDILAAGGSFAAGGYTRTISTLYGNPLAGRQAWSGTSGGFITTTVNLPPAAAGQSIQLKWRCGTDEDSSFTSVGWYIDTVSILDGYYTCCTSAAAPVIMNPEVQGGNFRFSIQTTAGQSYTVQYTSSLAGNAWTNLQTIIGDGSVKSATNVQSATQGFYRIRSP